MKMIKKISVFALAALLTFGVACNGETPNNGNQGGEPVVYENPNENFTTYNNKAYNEYLMGADVAISNQWTGYGIGDPFVMRYNGIYYLYSSSLDSESGVRGYKSADLVNWAPMTGEGLREGYVSEDSVTRAAYAPEVYHFNGTFYMYTSPAGSGHYVLTSQSPEGPFVKATNNFGLAIDGSVLIDDDEQMYFTYASSGGIRIAKMTDMLNVDVSSTPLLNGTSIGGWTEGSYILKRDGIYYLTYTGTHVTSDGYRIAYGTADSLLTASGGLNRNSFTRATNNPLALETESALKGLGHSSTVMGPDMDSHYLVYHMLNSSGGPNRSLGIDRLIFNGKQMSVAPGLEGSITPTLPEFYAMGLDEERFETVGDKVLSKAVTNETGFTAEFNLSGASEAVYYLGYESESSYHAVKVNLSAKTIELVNSSDEVLASGYLTHDFDASKLHTVRVASSGGKTDVYFDNMLKIDGASVLIKAGKIGYKANVGSIGYTAISSVAHGLSDAREPKQATAFIGANTYLRENTYAPTANLSSENSGLSVVEEGRMAGVNALTLAKNGDHASYLVNFRKSGRYGLELVYRAQDGGKKIGVKVNDGKVIRCTLPEMAGEDEYVKAVVGEFDFAQGISTVRLECLGEDLAYTCFQFVEVANVTPSFECALDNYAEKGADYKTIWKIKDGGHYAKAGTRQLVYFGDNTITDFTLEVEIKLEGATGTSSAGIVFHAQNYAASSFDNYMSLQGYYLAINNNQIVLDRLNYSDGTQGSMGICVENNPFASSDVWVPLKIQVRGNHISVWSGEMQIIDLVDDWGYANGKIGLYTNGAAAIYRNLKISA